MPHLCEGGDGPCIQLAHMCSNLELASSAGWEKHQPIFLLTGNALAGLLPWLTSEQTVA